jgi:hypothetical protein
MNLSNGDYSASVAHCLTLHRQTLNCTALTHSTEHGRSSHIASERTYRKHRLHHLVYLQSHLLATSLHAILCCIEVCINSETYSTKTLDCKQTMPVTTLFEREQL